MNFTDANARAKLLLVPAHKVLADFTANCSSDPETREATIAAMVISVWQMAARGMTHQLPSLLLVNTQEDTQDSILSFIRDITQYTMNSNEGRVGRGSFAGGTAAQAPEAMLQAVCAIKRHREAHPMLPPPSDLERYYHAARVTGYGDGRSSPYSKAWHPKLGLITDEKDGILLHLDEQVDHVAFRHDLLHEHQKLLIPTGTGTGLANTAKLTAITGSLSLEDFDEDLVDSIIELSQPFFFLPHVSIEPINIPNHPALSHFFSQVMNHLGMVVCTNPRFPDTGYFHFYQSWLWKHIEPFPPKYRFPVIEAVHQLYSVCMTISGYAKLGTSSSPSEQDLCMDLFIPTLRSMALSIAFLAWHGIGIELTCPLTRARKLLKRLRKEGSMSLRDVQRAAGFKEAAERDEVIRQLEDEGLVCIEGKRVIAVPMKKFLRSLQKQFPMA